MTCLLVHLEEQGLFQVCAYTRFGLYLVQNESDLLHAICSGKPLDSTEVIVYISATPPVLQLAAGYWFEDYDV